MEDFAIALVEPWDSDLFSFFGCLTFAAKYLPPRKVEPAQPFRPEATTALQAVKSSKQSYPSWTEKLGNFEASSLSSNECYRRESCLC